MIQEKIIPISRNGWDKQDELHHTYYEVEFIEDFGKFKLGEKFEAIDVNYGTGVIEAYVYNNIDKQNEITIRQEFKAVAIG